LPHSTEAGASDAAEPAPDPQQGTLDFKGLVGVRSILALIEAGVSLRRIRRSLEEVRERYPDLDDPVAAIRLWAEGSDRLVIRPEGVLEEPGGQVVFDLEPPSAQAEASDGVASIGEVAAETEPDDERLARTVIEWFERGCGLDADASTYQEAIDAYETALSLDESFADAHCNLGAVHYNRGDRETARRCFSRCLQLDAEHVEAHFNLANLLEEDGADEMALHHYLAALRADPMYPDLHINLALLHEKLGRGGKALEHWRRYLQLDADGPWSDVARQRLANPTDRA
jgi:tetratricopeptide (TPR) repeat protein